MGGCHQTQKSVSSGKLAMLAQMPLQSEQVGNESSHAYCKNTSWYCNGICKYFKQLSGVSGEQAEDLTCLQCASSTKER